MAIVNSALEAREAAIKIIRDGCTAYFFTKKYKESGIVQHEVMSFVNADAAHNWLMGIWQNAAKLNYTVIDHSFHNYLRD